MIKIILSLAVKSPYAISSACDCKCGLLAAELEGIKLDMVIMQRYIEFNNLAANTVPENEFKRLEKELVKVAPYCLL